jgi:membrane associated rhomboid family serine protease
MAAFLLKSVYNHPTMTMQSIIYAFSDTVAAMRANSLYVFSLLALLWGIQLLNFLLGYRLNVLGIYPRHLLGLLGIAFSPFLHGNASHLLFNSIPLFFLASLMLTFGLTTFYEVSGIIMVVSGICVWLVGRKGFHVGASGVIMGYLGFLLAQAYFHQSPFSLVLGGLTLYYCGSLLLNLLPTEVRTSWEAHLFGFLAGILSFWLI